MKRKILSILSLLALLGVACAAGPTDEAASLSPLEAFRQAVADDAPCDELALLAARIPVGDEAAWAEAQQTLAERGCLRGAGAPQAPDAEPQASGLQMAIAQEVGECLGDEINRVEPVGVEAAWDDTSRTLTVVIQAEHWRSAAWRVIWNDGTPPESSPGWPNSGVRAGQLGDEYQAAPGTEGARIELTHTFELEPYAVSVLWNGHNADVFQLGSDGHPISSYFCSGSATISFAARN